MAHWMHGTPPLFAQRSSNMLTLQLCTSPTVKTPASFRCDIIAFAGAFSDSGSGKSNLTSETAGLWQRLIKKSAKIEGGWSRSAL